MDKWTITAIDENKGTITISYAFDNLSTTPQTLSGMPLGDDKALETEIHKYGRGYRQGLHQEKSATAASTKVKALKDKEKKLREESEPTPAEG